MEAIKLFIFLAAFFLSQNIPLVHAEESACLTHEALSFADKECVKKYHSYAEKLKFCVTKEWTEGIFYWRQYESRLKKGEGIKVHYCFDVKNDRFFGINTVVPNTKKGLRFLESIFRKHYRDLVGVELTLKEYEVHLWNSHIIPSLKMLKNNQYHEFFCKLAGSLAITQKQDGQIHLYLQILTFEDIARITGGDENNRFEFR